MPPSGRLMVPSEPTGSPFRPPLGASSGCHRFRHAMLVQMKRPLRSADREYRVSPRWLTSTVAPSEAFLAVMTGAAVAVAVAAGALLLPPPLVDDPDPQAAARTSDTAVRAAVPRVPM